jgi:hypothetical protein
MRFDSSLATKLNNMEKVDILLEKWIPVNTVIREEVRNAIVEMKMRAMDKAYAQGHKMGVEAGLDYKINTNKVR